MNAILSARSKRTTLGAIVGLALIAFIIGGQRFHGHELPDTGVIERLRHEFSETSIIDRLRLTSLTRSQAGPAVKPADAVLAAASNATLGFAKIHAIHMKHRWDKWDAAVIQAHTSGIDLEYFEGVDGKAEIEDLGRIGLPPSRGSAVGSAQLACYRSHANIWSEMVRTKSPPVVVIESDAAWDANLRGIMGLANRELHTYLAEYVKHVNSSSTTIEPNPDDPWQSEHWDILALGHCRNAPPPYDEENMPTPRHYQDDFSLPENTKNRKVYRSGGWPCTNGYALSYRGAAKLLTRHALFITSPLDLIIWSMIDAGELVSFIIDPSPFVQWDYRANIGMGPGANSELSRIESQQLDKEYKDDGSGWKEVDAGARSIWEVSSKFGWVKFKTPAIGPVMYENILNMKDVFTMLEILPAVNEPELPQEMS